MPPQRLHDAKLVRRKNADGTVTIYRYDRITGARLPDGPVPADGPLAAPIAAPRYLKADPLAFQYVTLAMSGGSGPSAHDVTLGELARAWRYSSHFAELSPKTQLNYTMALRHVAVQPLLEVACREITRRSLRMLRDGIAEAGRIAKGRPTKQMANLTLNVLSNCFAWGVENFDLEVNPAAGVKRHVIEGGGHAPWSDDAIAAWLARGPEWSRRVVQLGLWTALRAADLIALRWDAWDGTALRVTPQKTRRTSQVSLYIPLSPEANATLAAWKSEPVVAATILTQPRGLPWSNSNNLAKELARVVARLQLPKTTVHGLRVTAATRLIEAGVPSRDVMALTGHVTEAPFARYVKHADQRQRAERAAAVWGQVIPLRPRVA